MSAPEVKTQSKPRVAHPTFSKFKKEDWAMRFASRIAKVNIPVKVLVGLAAGAMLITATAFTYHELGQGEAGSPPSSEQTENLPGFLQTEIWLPADTYPASVVTDPKAVRPPSNRELERLDYQADVMLIDAVRNPSASRPLSNRELERLDYQADVMLIDAVRNPSASRPLSNRELERLDYQADVMLIDAVRNPSASRPLSNRELERMDYAIDMMLRGLD